MGGSKIEWTDAREARAGARTGGWAVGRSGAVGRSRAVGPLRAVGSAKLLGPFRSGLQKLPRFGHM
jgi:hypothetical protein